MKNDSEDVSFSYFNDLMNLDINKCLRRKRNKFFKDSFNESPPHNVTPGYFQTLDCIKIEEVTICKRLSIKDILNSTSCSLSHFQDKIEIETIDDIELYSHNIKKPDHIIADQEKNRISNKPLPKFLSGKNLIDNAIKMANNFKLSHNKVPKISDDKSLDYLLDQLLESSSKY
jgi:hypothetical protein